MTIAFRFTVFGRVQGVGFRAFVLREAQRRGLRGWVRNRSDGSVEAVLVGADDAVAAVIGACEAGPPTARVDRAERFPIADDGSPDFAARPTV
jgi:acylphosphatase